MVVARNWRRRRSLAFKSSSPTSLMLPADGVSAPFCNSPITVSDVTDLPDPLSPTTHSVSPCCTCSEMPSMMRLPDGSLPRPTTRFWMSRMTEVMLIPYQPSLRGAKRRSNPVFLCAALRKAGLLRFARNDVERVSLAPLPLLHLRIERVAGGVADQVDAEDRDREQEAGPEDQRRLDLEVGAAFGHDVAPGRGFRIDAGAEERQDRLGENGGGANVSALHDQGCDRVRHQVPPHDLGQAGAHGYRRFDVGLLTRRQHDRAYQPGDARDFRNDDGDRYRQRGGAGQR